MARRRGVSTGQRCRTGENGRHQIRMGDEWRREWGLEMLMLMAARSIGCGMKLWRVCTLVVEGWGDAQGREGSGLVISC